MSRYAPFVLGYFLNSLWQVPLLFAAAWVAARALRRAGAAVEHRVWVGALLLQSLLPACSLSSFAWFRGLSLWGSMATRPGQGNVSVVMGPGVGLGALDLSPKLLSGILLLYCAVVAYFIVRLGWRSWSLARLRRNSTEVFLSAEAALCWARCCERFQIYDAVLAASSEIFGPVTMGIRRRLVLLPVSIVAGLQEEDLHTVVAHEFAHMRRKDFVKNLVYELLSLPVNYHPLLWLTRERVIESREMACDEMVAEAAGRREYARSLLRLASLLVMGGSVRVPNAIGIFDANEFERRLMKLTEQQERMGGVRRIATIAACVALAVGACSSALALRMNVNGTFAGGDGRAAAEVAGAVRVSAGVMAGSILSKVDPIYPEDARKAKIQGAVVLHVIIGKDGTITDLQVISGPQELRQSSLDAVSKWVYKPYLLNGDPTEVDTTITVNYSLSH
jgi:TonB family protein